MLTFDFEIELPANEPCINGLYMGHISIQGRYGSASTKSGTCFQNTMIFLSISMLLDGIRHFLTVRSGRHYRFIAQSCSFIVQFKRQDAETIIILSHGATIDQVRPTELVESVCDGIQKLLKKHHINLDDPRFGSAPLGDTSAAILHDFKNSVADFKAAFQLSE